MWVLFGKYWPSGSVMRICAFLPSHFTPSFSISKIARPLLLRHVQNEVIFPHVTQF